MRIHSARTGYMAVQQYLCVGEAPLESQQAFQQRSRWSKGHFQVRAAAS